MFRRSVATVGVVILLTLSIQPHSASADTPSPSDAQVQQYKVGDVLASGRVTNGAGVGVAGAPVIVRAWPDPNSLKGQKAGDTIAPIVLSETVTDEKGGYVLSNTASVDSRAAAQSTTNLEFYTLTDAGPTQWFSTLSSADGTTSVAVDAAERDDSFATSAAKGSILGTSIDAQRATPSSGVPLNFTVSGKAEPVLAAAGRAAPSNCTLTTNLGAKEVIVGQTYSTVSGGHTRRFIHSTGATSTFGVGISVTGAYGTFSSSGTTSASSTNTTGFSAFSDATGRAMKTKFTFGKYRCWYGGVVIYYRYTVYPTGFAGGTYYQTVSNPTANYCVTQSAGSFYNKEGTTAVSWSNGISLKSAIGIDLSSRTGYSTSAKLNYSFSSQRRICGQTAYPGSSPLTVVVKS